MIEPLSSNHENLILLVLGVFSTLIKASDDGLNEYIRSLGIFENIVTIFNKISNSNITLPIFLIQYFLASTYYLDLLCKKEDLLKKFLRKLGKHISNNNTTCLNVKNIIKVYGYLVKNEFSKIILSEKVPKILFTRSFYMTLDVSSKNLLENFYDSFKNCKIIMKYVESLKTNIPFTQSTMTVFTDNFNLLDISNVHSQHPNNKTFLQEYNSNLLYFLNSPEETFKNNKNKPEHQLICRQKIDKDSKNFSGDDDNFLLVSSTKKINKKLIEKDPYISDCITCPEKPTTKKQKKVKADYSNLLDINFFESK